MKLKFIMLILLLATTASYAQTISEVFFPQYIQGVGNFNPADDRKVPYVCRMTLGGLMPGATYRYFNRFVLNPASTSTGEGNYILIKDSAFIRVTAASLAANGRYGQFTTDSTGAYTGWFAVEPNATSTYVPGSKIYFRVCLNN